MRDCFALQSFLSKKWSGRNNAESNRGVGLRGPGGVAHQPFEHGQIVEKAAVADFRQPATGMRPVALVALGNVDQAGFLQYLEMAAEIAVGQAAKLLEVGKSQPLRMRHQRAQYTETRLLVNDPIESFI